jgi:L-iditol 2-dehydrogenase
MKAAVLHGVKDLRVEQVPEPGPRDLGPRDCLVRIHAVGVCGSDVHYYEHGKIGPFVVEEPLILGHECSGTVEAVGSEVERIKEGDRVAIEPGVPCRRCELCLSGRYNLCRDVVFMATPPVDGSFCERVIHPDDFLYPLPEGVSFEEGAMVEPLAVGVYAAQRAGIRPGDTVAVLGCGTIGLLALQAAQAAGATRVLATDVVANRLALAAELGAETFDASGADTVAALTDATGGRGADVVLETAGTVATTQQTVKLVRSGGMVCLVGLPPDSVLPFDVMEILTRELDLSSVFRYANCFGACVELISAGKVNLAPLVTGRYPLASIEEAFEFASTRKDECIKLVVDVAGG